MKLTIEKFKPLIGVKPDDTTADTLLTFILEDVEEIILNYCNIGALPAGLEKTAYRMAMDLYRNEGFGQAESSGGSVSSIEEGDTKVSFAGGAYADNGFSNSLLKAYAGQLNRYRRLVW